MRLSFKEWIIFIVIAIVCLGAWYKLSYPQFTVFDYKIDKKAALLKAENFLSSRGVDTSKYLKSIIFFEDFWADRYLQKTLGFRAEEEFLKEHSYELFAWSIRFFKQGQKEEYFVNISPRTAEILYFSHRIEDTQKRETKDKAIAKQMAKSFLETNYKLDLAQYDFHEEKAVRLDNRIDYQFSWEKKGVYIPWQGEGEAGGAKLIVAATVAGSEIKDFYKIQLDIPEKFERYVEGQTILGRSINSVFNFIFFGWIAWAIVIIIRRKDDSFIRLSWRWLVFIGGFIFIAGIIYFFNDFQSLLFGYVTSSSLVSYLGVYFMSFLIGYIFLSISIVMVGVAGESLRYELFPKNKLGSFLHYINSTLFSRSVSVSIVLGYLLVVIFLGIQAIMFALGQKYLGVWVERIRLTDITSAYMPFLTAFIIGCRASFSEEIIYRIFGIYWTKKYFKNIVLAVLIPAVVWGFSHTEYPIFPVWFRGIEVTVLGVCYGFIFLRYGIIPLLVSHYLFDVFWGVSGFILGNTSSYLFYSAIFILLLPLIFAFIAFYINKKEIERKLEMVLTADQRYNLNILKHYLQEKQRSGMPVYELKQELISHGWDRLTVELAIKEVLGEKSA